MLSYLRGGWERGKAWKGARTVHEQHPLWEARDDTAEGRRWPVVQGPVRLRPFPSPTPLITARGIFQTHKRTSDPKDETRRIRRMQKEVWCFLDWFQWGRSAQNEVFVVRKISYLCFMYLLFTYWCYFQRVQKHVWISRMRHVMLRKRPAVNQLYTLWVAIMLVYDHCAYSLL